MRKLITIAIMSSTLLFVGQSQAGLLGFSAGAGVWNPSPSGSFRADQNSTRIDMEDDLQLNSDPGGLLWVQWDHILPLIPNVQLRYTRASLDGDGSVSQDFTFAGTTFSSSENVKTDFELEQLDIIAYYGLWLPLVDIDFGLNLKYLDGETEVTRRSSGESQRVSFSGVLPLAWARVQADLPFTGLYAGGEIGGIGWDGDYVMDMTLRVGYRAGLVLGSVGLEAGWKRQKIRLDNFDRTDLSVRLEGPYAAATLTF